MFFFLMIRRPPRSTQSRSSAASDVYKRQLLVLLHPLLPYRVELLEFQHVSFLNPQPLSRLPGPHCLSPPVLLVLPQLLESSRRSLRLQVLALPLTCLLYTSPSPRDRTRSRMPSSA
eukprot:TRINITY_DN3150_c0_g1_i1.p1 TRINITY_DN3150_c0_g1~~TRINITY_DN3150_c0_g1_i1.p1  ORF type:complete len:117 (-),score=62.31 TRINITY_DN3150_c0_g1_i1:57-407(-)